jgi:hypothetical protein
VEADAKEASAVEVSTEAFGGGFHGGASGRSFGGLIESIV